MDCELLRWSGPRFKTCCSGKGFATYHFTAVEVDFIKVVLMFAVSDSKSITSLGSYVDQTLLLNELHVRKGLRR